MDISKQFLVAIIVILLVVVLVGFVYIQAEIQSLNEHTLHFSPASSTPSPTPIPVVNGHPNLTCYVFSLAVAQNNAYQYYLAVDANIGNSGNATAVLVRLWIQTYFPDGKESINYNMTVFWNDESFQSDHPFFPLATVDLAPGEVYNIGNHAYDAYMIPDNLRQTDFYASV